MGFCAPPFALPADSIEFTLDLPVPPSVNKLRKITQDGRKLLKAYKAQADIHVVLEWRNRHHKNDTERFKLPIRKLTGQFEAVIQFGDDSSNMDADNLIKTVMDFAVSREFVKDDGKKYMRRVMVEYRDDMSGCKLKLRSLHEGSRG